ncbi:MAG: cache domain-containing protein [Candidatus Omnitrophica bacterium]|nr:cache domain-containing protein [Candidatus Omnitrophota bacterium]
MKIANKISLSFFVAVLILMTIAGTIFYLTAKDSLQKSIYNNLTAVLASRSSHIETYLKMLETSVGQLSRSATLEDFLKISDKESPERNDAFLAEMKRLARIKEANPAIAEFLLMDKRGLAAASSNKSSVGLDKSADPIFLIGQKEIYIKDVYFSEVYKEPLMAVSAPIIDNVTGELSGVLAARVRLNDLNDIVANRTGKGETGEIYIVNERGYMITPSRFDKGTVLKQKVDSEAVRHALLHKDRAHVLPNDKFVDIYPDYRGVPTLGAHEYIPRMRWAVIAEIDAKEAFRPLAMIHLIFILILFIVPAAGWLLGISIAMLITASLRRLRKGIEMVGTGNLDYKVDTGTKDEAGQLSRAFDTMTQSLKLTNVSVDGLNKEITARKNMEKEMRETAERFQRVSSLISDIAYSCSTAGGSFYKIIWMTGATDSIFLQRQTSGPSNGRKLCRLSELSHPCIFHSGLRIDVSP